MASGFVVGAGAAAGVGPKAGKASRGGSEETCGGTGVSCKEACKAARNKGSSSSSSL